MFICATLGAATVVQACCFPLFNFYAKLISSWLQFILKIQI